MKQYLDQQQTAKLIELGFEKPGSIASVEPIYGMGGISVAKAYSIGELIEMLPAKIDGTYCNIDRYVNRNWVISYDPMIYCCNRAELVDALYDMVVKLKEEGVI